MPELVVAVVGPTAAGKSDLALRIAHAAGGEIINADSMQLYAGMDIGTAKLTVAEREGVPHHLLDILDMDAHAVCFQFAGYGVDKGIRFSDEGFQSRPIQ